MRHPRGQRLFRVQSLMVLVGGLVVNQAADAAEYIRQESPTPASAKDLDVSIEHAFTAEPLSKRFLLEDFKELLEDEAEFWRDAKFSFDLRSYLFERRNSSVDKPEAFVIGGQLSFESGWWNDLALKVSH